MRPMRHWSRKSMLLALPLLALAFVGLNWLSSSTLRGARLDLTQHRLYTLSPGTLRILQKVPEPITLQLYWSERASEREPQFRVFAQRVRELLEEMAARSNGKVRLQVVDPQPFTDAEDRATEYGLTGVPLGQTGDTLYFGLVGSNSTDGESVMPFIQPSKEAFLEYDLARMITTLSNPGKPVLAVLSALPTGPGYNPMTGEARPAWVMDRQLAEFFDVRRLQANPTSIADDVNVLMVVHPKDPTPETQYAIDQFVLRGGHLLVFVDPDAESDPAGASLDPTEPASSRSSGLPQLFAAWGLEYDPGKVVLDRAHSLKVQPNPAMPPVDNIAMLGLKPDSMNQKDVVTAELETIDLASAGALSLRADAPMKLEPLLQSSANAALADTQAVRAAASDPSVLLQGFKPDGGGPYVLAGRLTGSIKTAFPERSGAQHLAASKRPANILVVADTDLLSDRMWVQAQDFLGQQVLNPFANNADFVYNAVDNLSGDDDLIQVRTRPTSQRPFERIDAVRRAADARYQAKAQELQQELDALEQKLERLQPTTADGKPQALGREQQAELLQVQRDKLRLRKELREVQLQLNADIEKIGTRIKQLDILAVPALVLLAALAIGLRRRWRRRAPAR
jgi:ABC-type uncharacterized transport system involved in gliding motility auxiliary subunit